MSYNAWLYAMANSVRYKDSTGFQATYVECDQIMLPELRRLCMVANMDDKDPIQGEEVLQAREAFFKWIVDMSYAWSLMPEPWGGEGYRYAGKMLNSFLNSSGYIRINLGGNTRFDDDPGIMRATWKSMPALYSDEPTDITPLLYTFLLDYIKNLSEKYLKVETRHDKNGILYNPFHLSASPCQRIPQNPKISIVCQASYGSF